MVTVEFESIKGMKQPEISECGAGARPMLQPRMGCYGNTSVRWGFCRV